MATGSPFFETEPEMKEAIQEYMNNCKPEYLVDPSTGEYMLDKGQAILLSPNKPTITGLALALGFESRQSMYDYEKKETFSYTIKRARLEIENSYEQDIRNPDLTPTGAIFALKNFGWSDKQEVINKTINEDGEEVGVNAKGLTEDEAKAMFLKLKNEN